MEKLLSGNEAFARGAYEAGVQIASAYPGTPSTEILQNILNYKNIYAEWSPNEKTSLEVAIGGAIAGVRALAIMKHVGVNVAADPLFSFSYTGLRKGLVIITADDPGMHSSQNEQDNRYYAKFAKIPMLEPSDSNEAIKFLKIAFDISEKYDTPVFVRSTTRISHSKSIVKLSAPKKFKKLIKLEKNPQKFVMLPNNARARHLVVEEELNKLKKFADTFEENKEEINNKEFGIITSGIAYYYAKEVFPSYSFLKIATPFPLPENKIKKFAKKVKKLFVIEELEPFMEEQIKSLGIKVIGKDLFPICGEFSPDIIENNIKKKKRTKKITPLFKNLPIRPPNMCSGCPHRSVFYVLKKLKVFVAGDIGCYTLAAIPPLAAMDTCICMGASIGNAIGIEKSLDKKSKKKVVAILGESTFMHSGITGLLNMVYNKSKSTVIILDNRITAMTGRQENPASGYTASGEKTKSVDFKKLAIAIGVDKKNVKEVDPYDLKTLEKIIKSEINKKETSCIITKAPCLLLKRENPISNAPLKIDTEKCIGCKICLQISCPAILWDAKIKKVEIDNSLCVGCNVCAQICKYEAIT